MSQRARWTLIVVLLTPPVVVPLLVGLYDRTDPMLFGFPFFFWFQLALILGAVLLTGVAYALAPGGGHAPDRSPGTARDGDGR